MLVTVSTTVMGDNDCAAGGLEGLGHGVGE